ncbi:MAG: orotidine 5'-phosphate decarboxylase [Deltaproteobacteria bacterium RIFCSPLOWO2_02_FULL_50_16]|nr:MAG: orotidine 5'-phosphate decarboxylase [Deltaproteobacteria bacterium GWA2_50_8]OGQ30228.1 MAG: orotidine 5'-phosphate decarboxylase [Deltaproteobacteria bacterium RIFCSPHIGHO2_02_FULL_50_15]OGQ55867.1 MAG: orotidine 5'-phosphate decarboxylase [Deltaproteobacteria bacterium RIFCSPLOWO2_02_FULL_50_16]OGQ66935.1 MAG: orotidine 5'-phosphate decarboxylase [Deltaproteobacteria bacterium RIFCSPLOWO2_12_FULL_50_11]
MRSEKLIVALDVSTEDDAKELIRQLKKDVTFFKVGLQLFTSAGSKIISYLHKSHLKTFLDLKFFDVPATVGKACMEATKKGVSMLNVHALGGREMIERAVDATGNIAEKLEIRKPLLLAVTVLTSSSNLGEIGLAAETKDLVLKLALMAKEAGADGVVCSPQEIEAVRRECGDNFVIVTPGIRLPDQEPDDQKRIATPAAAIKAGADYIVVGRPITKAEDPLRVVQIINASIHDMEGWTPPVKEEEVSDQVLSQGEGLQEEGGDNAVSSQQMTPQDRPIEIRETPEIPVPEGTPSASPVETTEDSVTKEETTLKIDENGEPPLSH